MKKQNQIKNQCDRTVAFYNAVCSTSASWPDELRCLVTDHVNCSCHRPILVISSLSDNCRDTLALVRPKTKKANTRHQRQRKPIHDIKANKRMFIPSN